MNDNRVTCAAAPPSATTQSQAKQRPTTVRGTGTGSTLASLSAVAMLVCALVGSKSLTFAVTTPRFRTAR